MDFYEMLDIVTITVDTFVSDSTEQVKPETIGLDNRAGYKLFLVREQCACDKHEYTNQSCSVCNDTVTLCLTQVLTEFFLVL